MEKKEETKEAPEARTRFNTVVLHKSSRRNAIRAYVHSDQVVMAGSTLKMRLGEDCLTDDGRRVRKDSPVYGEVRKIDGERVIVEIRTVNVGGNILPFKKKYILLTQWKVSMYRGTQRRKSTRMPRPGRWTGQIRR